MLLILTGQVFSNNTFNIQYDKYIKNYYSVSSSYDACKEYFNNFENKLFELNENNIIYKNKLDKFAEYIKI